MHAAVRMAARDPRRRGEGGRVRREGQRRRSLLADAGYDAVLVGETSRDFSRSDLRRSGPARSSEDRTMRFHLPADKMPTAWFNVLPRLRRAAAAAAAPGHARSRSAPTTSRRCSRWRSSSRRCPAEPWIDIPGEVLDILRLWRPTPLVRAERLERALGTPARIYYKDESVSPAGSHKPNTAVPQAFYNKAEGIDPAHHRDRRRPVGHGARVRVRAVRPRVQGVHGPRVVRAEAVPPDDDGDVGRASACRRRSTTPTRPGSLGLAISDAVRDAASRADTPLLARLGAQPRAAAPDGHRPRGQGAAGTRRRDPARRRHRAVRRRLEPRRHRAAVRGGPPTVRLVAVEPSSCPTLTEGRFEYDFGDTAGMTPLLPMYTLGHDFMPPPIHAGGLRYHGDSPIISPPRAARADGGDRLPAGQGVRGGEAVRPRRGQDRRRPRPATASGPPSTRRWRPRRRARSG